MRYAVSPNVIQAVGIRLTPTNYLHEFQERAPRTWINKYVSDSRTSFDVGRFLLSRAGDLTARWEKASHDWPSVCSFFSQGRHPSIAHLRATKWDEPMTSLRSRMKTTEIFILDNSDGTNRKFICKLIHCSNPSTSIASLTYIRSFNRKAR